LQSLVKTRASVCGWAAGRAAQPGPAPGRRRRKRPLAPASADEGLRAALRVTALAEGKRAICRVADPLAGPDLAMMASARRAAAPGLT
jgi:hypothetical protein